MHLAGSVVLVTGSTRGIGAATAAALHRRGAHVLLHGRSIDRLDPTAAALGVKALRADLRDASAVDELARAAADVHGRLDGVVHCAGVGWLGSDDVMSPACVDELIGTNLRAPIRLTQAVLPAMLDRGHGHLAFVGSIAGLVGVAREAVYAATKAGLDMYAQSLTLQLHRTGVGVSVVHPGAVATDFFAHHGTAYTRRCPAPIAPDRVAAAVVDGIENDIPWRVMPRWLRLAGLVRTMAPTSYRRLATRFG